MMLNVSGLKNRRTDVRLYAEISLAYRQTSKKTYGCCVQLLHVSFSDDEQRTFPFDIAIASCLIQHMTCISCVVITRDTFFISYIQQINIIDNIGTTDMLLIFTLDTGLEVVPRMPTSMER